MSESFAVELAARLTEHAAAPMKLTERVSEWDPAVTEPSRLPGSKES